jgi:hypothetical protein
MSVLDWILSTALIALYLGLLFTVCMVTFQKGHYVLGIVGIFIPWLWLIGALLPAKPSSPFALREAARMQTRASQANPTDQAGHAGPAVA